MQHAGDVVDALSPDRAMIARLVENLGTVSNEIGQRGALIHGLATDALTTFRSVAGEDVAVRATLEQLPSTLRVVRSATGTIGSATGSVAPVFAGLATGLRELKPAIALLQPAGQEGKIVLSALSSAAPPLTRTLSDLHRLGRPAETALPQLRKLLCQVNPAVDYIAPYARDIAAMVLGFGSSSNVTDSLGHMIRATPVFTPEALVGLPAASQALVEELLRNGILQKSYGRGYDPYPPPNTAGTQLGMGIPGPAAFGKQYKYPHVLAAC